MSDESSVEFLSQHFDSKNRINAHAWTVHVNECIRCSRYVGVLAPDDHSFRTKTLRFTNFLHEFTLSSLHQRNPGFGRFVTANYAKIWAANI